MLKIKYTLSWGLFLVLGLLLVAASPAWAAPVPSVALSVSDPEPFIGEDITLQLSFDNTDVNDTGYGPFIDLILPVTGIDGDDGIDLASGVTQATYLGVPVTTITQTFPDEGGGSGCVEHPYAVDGAGDPLSVCGVAGDKLVTLQLPFGSFVPEQPAATLELKLSVSNLADLGAALDLQARAGFQFGADPLDNPTKPDPTLLGPDAAANKDGDSDSGNWTVTQAVTPKLITLVKTYNGPEDETATGPNFPRQYTITVEVAEGQEVTNLDVSDFLPNNMAYTELIATNPTSTTISEPSPVDAASATPDNELKVNFASITGGTPATVTFEYFIPLMDAAATSVDVLDPTTGDDVISENQAKAIGDWDPIDVRDEGGSDNAVADPAGVEHTLTDKSIAIQKSVAIVGGGDINNVSPGDILEYTLQIQVSDFFSMDQVVVTDTMSDGQRFDDSFTPTLISSIHGAPSSGDMTSFVADPGIAGTDITEKFSVPADGDKNNGTDGTTEIRFRVSDELFDRSNDVRMTGGCVPLTGTGVGVDPDCGTFNEGATTATLTFRTIIQQEFSDDFPSGDSSVDQGDTLSNNVTVQGRLLSVEDNSSTDNKTEADGSSASVSIAYGALSKSIYKVNDSDPSGNPVQLKPGDKITYRFSYTMPTSDVEDLAFIDYLPKPVLIATEVDGSFDSNAIPAAGKWGFGPDDTFSDVYQNANAGNVNRPDITTNAQENSITFTYGDYDTTDQTSRQVDILFTVTVTDDPFADDLFLTNQVRTTQDSTNADDNVADSIVQIHLREPVLEITKGYSVETGPGTIAPLPSTLPIDGDITGSDAGDTLTYVITVENTGGAPGYAVTVTDAEPEGLKDCSVKSVTDGGGSTDLTFTGNLFTADLILTNPLTANDKNPLDGGAPFTTDTALITVECTVDDNVEPGQIITETASVVWKAGNDPGATSFAPRSDAATVTIGQPSMDKTVKAISLGYAGNLTHTHIGEAITYKVVMTLPEGVSKNVTLVDTVDAGLAITDVLSITASTGISTSVGNGFEDVKTAASITNVGSGDVNKDRSLSLDFGNLTNSDTDNDSADTLTIEYQARVINSTANNRGAQLGNSAVWTYDDPAGGTQDVSDSAPDVTIIEPTLEVTKSITADTGDAGDTLTVTLDVSHASESNADAFDVTLEDILPAGFTYVALSASSTSGKLSPNTGPAESSRTLSAAWDSFAQNDSAQITFQVTVDPSVNPTAQIENTATVLWESLKTADEAGLPDASNNPLDVERTGSTADTGASANDYKAEGSDSFTVDSPVLAKSISSVVPEGASGSITNGDIVTYELFITLPEGTTPGLLITDTLPPGLQYMDASAAIESTGFGGTLANSGNLSVDNSGGDVATTGQIVTFTLTGDTVVTNDDIGANDSFAITFDALVLNDAANAATSAAQTKTNTAKLSFTDYSGPTISDTASINYVEPVLEITKTMDPDSGLDAGDTVTIILDLKNTGTGPAHDVRISDILNNGGELLFDITETSSVNGSDSAGFTYAYAGSMVSYSLGTSTLAAGASVQLSFTAKVLDTVVTGSSYDNTASVTYGTQTGEVDKERSKSDSDTDTASVDAASVAKTLTATSENTSDPDDASLGSNPPVLIGEVLDYSLSYTLPEGVISNLVLVDLLPAGLSYVDGSATLEKSSVDLESTDNPGSIDEALVNTPVAVSLDTTTANQLRLALGDVTNSNTSDGTAETYTLKLKLLVANISDNAAGDDLDNKARLEFDDRNAASKGVDSTAVSVHVAEPQLAVTKGASPAAPVGGGIVTFSVTVSNSATGTNAATAFDGTFADTLPLRYKLSPAPTVTAIDLSNTAMTGSDVSASFSGRALTGGWTALAAGESFTITYTATIDEDTPFAETVTNSFTGSASSLPGLRGASDDILGNPGQEDGERIASDSTRYTSTDTASVSLAKPTLTKTTLNHQTRYAIGESVDFRITVGVPVGASEDFVVSDTLDAGLSFDANSLSVTLPSGATLSNTPATEANDTIFFTHSGQNLSFDFGTLSIPNSGNIIIEYSATVANVIANQDGTSLDNSASLVYDDPDDPGTATINAGPVATDRPAVVGEPNLSMSKSITNGAAGKDAGDTVAWRIDVENTGAVTAYQVNWSELLPDGLFQIANAALTISSGDVYLNDTSTPPVNGNLAVTTNSNTNDRIALPPLQIEAGATLSITFNSTLMDTVVPGQSINNVTRAHYTSLADGGRDNSTDPGNVDDDDNNDLNNYEESASQELSVASDIAIDKTADKSSATLGETLTYSIQVDLIEGVTPSVVVTDILPLGLSYVSHLISAGNMGMSFGNPSYNIRLGTGQTVSFDFGNVTNPPGGSQDDFITVAVTARVDNILANQNADDLPNGEGASEVYVEYGSGPSRVNFDHDAGSDGIQGLPLTVIEPDLSVAKTADTHTPSLGDIVTYTVQISHSVDSTADAFDLTVTDTLPPGLSYVPDSTSLPASNVSVSGPNLTFSIATLARVPGSASFTYQARVDNDATVGQDLTNDLALVWASLDGGNGDADDGRNGEDGSGELNDYVSASAATVTPNMDSFIDAAKTVAISIDGAATDVADPGDELTYTITLTNEGGETADNVIFTDTIPANTAYAPGSLTTSAGSVNDSADPDLQVSVGALAEDASVTISFRVTIDAGTPTGTIISNQGVVDSDQTVPEPTDVDGVDSNGDQPTDIPVGGAPSVSNALYLEKVVEWLIDDDNSGDVSPGDTLRYWLIANNQGDETLTGVTISDTIPAGLSYVGDPNAAVSGAGTITVTGSSVAVAMPGVAVNDYEYAVFDVTVDDPLANNNGGANDELFDNQATGDSDQTDPVPSDSNGDPSDGNQPTAISAVTGGATPSPALDVEKRWSLAIDSNGNGLVNPGDTLEYTLRISNTGAAVATDLRLGDAIPTDTQIVSGSVFSSQGTVTGEDPVSVNLGNLNPGAVASVRFQVTVDGGTADGALIENQANVSGDDGINEDSDDNGLDSDGKNPTLTPVDSGGGSAAGAPSGLSKTLQASSEADSSGANVMIGEIATFRVAINVPAGSLREVQLSDTLPEGLAYVAGTARLAHGYNTGLNASLNPGGINSAASGDFVNLSDAGELVVSGQTLSVLLGDLINSDNDVDNETYTLEYQALVSNIASNQAGGSLSNEASVSYLNGLGQPQSLTPVSQTLTLLEPNVQIVKSANPAAILPSGGDVSFTVTVSNPAGANVATAYDVNVSDSLQTPWSSLTVDSITPSGEAAGITDNSAGTTIDVTIDTLPPGGQVVIVYTASAPGPLTAGALDNTARTTWTSLPGAQGTDSVTPGNAGDTDGERSGSGSGPNDYAAQDSEQVVVGSVGLSKDLINAQTRYAIGDSSRYRVVLSLPAGISLSNADFSDVLDQGLSYVSGTLDIVYATGVSSSAAPSEFSRSDNTPGAGQETLALDFGTLSNSSGASSNVTLTYDARVDNIVENQDNQSLNDVAALDFDDPGAPSGRKHLDDDASVTVGEPLLSLSKTILGATTGLDAGDAISYQVTLGNSGTTSAYDVLLSDTLPIGLENIGALSVTSATGGAETPALTNNGLDWQSAPFDVPVGGQVIIAFTAQLSTGVIPGEALQNSAQASYSSRDGVDANERDGADGVNGALDDYAASANAPSFTVADPVQIDKRFHPDATDSDYTLGETLSYRLLVAVLEGAINDLQVTDTLPDGVRFLSAQLGVGNLGLSTGYSGSPAQSGQQLSFDLGTIGNPSNGDANDDFISIDISVVVEDVSANQDGELLGNHAGLSFSGAGGTEYRDYDADTEEQGIQPLDLEIIEPLLVLTKTANRDDAPQGEEVLFTLRLDHAAGSRADAYDLLITDTLPEGMSYVPGSASVPVSVSGRQLTFAIAVLTLADDATQIEFRARVAEAASAGDVLRNEALVAYSTRPGDNPDERAYSDNAAAEVTVLERERLIDLSLEKSVAPYAVTVGDQATFSLRLANAGPNAASGIEVTDNLPAGLTYLSHWSNSGSYDSATGIWRPSELPAGESVLLQITVEVTALADYTNTAQVTAALGVDVDSTPGNDDGDQSEDDEARAFLSGEALDADLSLRKQVDEPSPEVGHYVTYTLSVRNNGPANATGVAVRDRLPSGLANPVNISDGGAASGSTVVWSNLAIPVGDIRHISFQAEVLESGGYRNLSEITAADQSDRDSTPNNDDGDQSEDDEDFATVTPIRAYTIDLSLDKQVNERRPQVGEVVGYTLVLHNEGPGAASNVAVRDVTPSGLGAPSAISDGGVFSGGQLNWSGLSLAAGQSLYLSYEAQVLASAQGAYRNIAQVAAADQQDLDSTPNNDNGDQSEDDESSVALLPVDQPEPPPVIAKRFDPRVIDLGEHSRLIITLINASNQVMTLSEDLADIFPSGLWIDAFPHLGGTCPSDPVGVASGGVVIYPAGAQIPVGGCEIWVDVTGDGGSHINSIGVGLLVTDGGSNEEPATSEILVDPADIQVIKTLSAGGNLPGELLTYELSVSNLGPDPAEEVTVSDSPVNLSIESVTGACDALPCTLATLGVNETVTIQVKARVPANAAPGDGFSNTATANAARPPDPNNANNSSRVDSEVSYPRTKEIPTLSEWALLILAFLMILVARRHFGRRDGECTWRC